jgi:hypothetical protein
MWLDRFSPRKRDSRRDLRGPGDARGLAGDGPRGNATVIKKEGPSLPDEP